MFVFDSRRVCFSQCPGYICRVECVRPARYDPYVRRVQWIRCARCVHCAAAVAPSLPFVVVGPHARTLARTRHPLFITSYPASPDTKCLYPGPSITSRKETFLF